MTSVQFTGHAFKGYDDAVLSLINELDTMATSVEELLGMLDDAIHGKEISTKIAKKADKEINQLEYDVIHKLHSILVKYSPTTHELRFLISTVRIAASIERLGDIAKVNIWRCQQIYGEQKEMPDLFLHTLITMLSLARNMLRDSLRNLAAFDSNRLSTILDQDDEVNRLYATLMDTLRTMPKQHPLIAILTKDIERAADHAFEIGRIAHFAHTGIKPRKKEIRQD